MNNHSTWNLDAYDRRHPEDRHGPDIHAMAVAGLVHTEGQELGDDGI